VSDVLVVRAGQAGADHASGLRRILANALSLFLAYLLPKLLTIGSVVVAARVLGATRFGAYGTAAAWAVILSIVATLGMQPLLIREMARAPDGAATWLRAAHVVKTVSNVLMLVLLVWLGRSVFGYPQDVLNAALLLAIGYAIAAYADNLSAYFQSAERMEVWMQASACYGLITGALGVVLVLTTRSVAGFCAAPIAGHAAALVWLAARAPRGHRLGGRVELAAVLRLLRVLVPFAIGFTALTAHSKIDVLVLDRLWQPVEVGVYTAAHKFIDVIQALAVVGAAAVYPRLARSVSTGHAATRLIELTVLSGLLAGGALWIARAGAVALLFGADYSAAVSVTAWLAIAIPALAINIVGGYVLAARGAMSTVALLYAVALAVKIGLNLLLVPGRGADGTALAMLLTEVALAGAMLVALHAAAGVRLDARVLRALALGAVLAAAFAAAGTALAPRDPTGGFVPAALFTFGVLAICTATGTVSREDRALFAAALRGRRP
jgi:O-antigen/teichoic acid export membrane protein